MGDLDPRGAGTRVLDDVRERLLNDPVDGRLKLRRQATVPSAPAGELETGVNPQPFAPSALKQRLDRRRQSELIESRRAQVVDDLPQVRDFKLDVGHGL